MIQAREGSLCSFNQLLIERTWRTTFPVELLRAAGFRQKKRHAVRQPHRQKGECRRSPEPAKIPCVQPGSPSLPKIDTAGRIGPVFPRRKTWYSASGKTFLHFSPAPTIFVTILSGR